MNQRIRIAFVITELEVGGAERCLVNLACGMDRRRFEPAIYSLAPRPSGAMGRLVRQLDTTDIPVHFVDVYSPLDVVGAIRRLRGMLKEFQPSVVQTFLFHANVVGTLAAKIPSVQAIVSGVRVADPTRWRHHLERLASRRMDRVVCVSRSVADFCQQRVRLAPEKLLTIPNGIDLQPYPAPPADLAGLALPANRKMLTYVGRLHPQKGLDWLLRLAPQLLTRLPDHDLLLVGSGPQRDRLMSLARKGQIAHRVHFAGWRPDVPRLLAASSMLMLPSRWEGMPNVVLEAMATRLPVLCTRADGVVELLGDAADEQTVLFGDTEGLLAKTQAIAADQAYADQLGGRNRQRVEATFSLQGMISTYEQLYLDLLASAGDLPTAAGT